MPTSCALRLDQTLVQAAALAADAHKRSLPKQIEYWATLGRLVERTIDIETAIALLAGTVTLKIHPLEPVSVSLDQAFSQLNDSTLLSLAPQPAYQARQPAAIRYQCSQDYPGYLECLHSDGRVEIGQFQQGEFKVLTP